MKKKSSSRPGPKSKQRLLIYMDPAVLKIFFSAESAESKNRLFLKEVKDFPPEKIADEIRKIVRPVSIDAGAILFIPRIHATIKNIILPSAKEDEISSMLQFQLARLVPHALDEIVFGYKILKFSPEKTHVRVIIVLKKLIEHNLSILNNAGVYPEEIYIGSEMLPNSIAALKRSILIDIDFALTQVSFIDEGHIVASRAIELGSADLLNPSRHDPFVSGVRESLVLKPHHFQNQKIPVTISGGKGILPKTTSFVSSLSLADPIFHENRIALEINSVELSDRSSSLIFESFLDTPDRHSLNLLPKEVKMHFEKRGLAKLLKKFAIGLCLLIFVSSGFTVTEYFLEHRDYLKTVRKIESISAQAEQLDQIRTSLIILKEHLKQRAHAWDSVQSLFHSLPQDISIKSMGYDSRRLNIRGYASNLSKIFEFAGVLQKNPLFSKIETKYARQNTLGRSEYSEFSIECWFQP